MKMYIAPGGMDVARYLRKVRAAPFWTLAAREWHRLYAPWVPMDTGALLNNVSFAPGQVTHHVPYARRVYGGEGMNFRRDKHPLAAPRWDLAAAKAQKPALIRALQAYVDGGGLELKR